MDYGICTAPWLERIQKIYFYKNGTCLFSLRNFEKTGRWKLESPDEKSEDHTLKIFFGDQAFKCLVREEIICVLVRGFGISKIYKSRYSIDPNPFSFIIPEIDSTRAFFYPLEEKEIIMDE